MPTLTTSGDPDPRASAWTTAAVGLAINCACKCTCRSACLHVYGCVSTSVPPYAYPLNPVPIRCA